MSTMTMSDAVVALRSLPRRYREVVGGPVGDDTWDRLVRTIDASQRSALGWTLYCTQLVTALGTVILELPMTARPVLDLAKIQRSRIEVPRATDVPAVLAELSANAERAAVALSRRSHDDFEREIVINGHAMEARQLVETVVRDAVAHIRDAANAVQSARSAS
jgi:hypothetical protein